MDFTKHIIPENMDFYRVEKPIQSVYLEFVRQNCGAILDLGEFEALRCWLESVPVCMPMLVRPAESHRITRGFYRALRKEQKCR